MQNVSQAYIDSMKSPLRERGYIRVVFGVLNTIAQNTAVITSDNEYEYSDTSRIFNNGMDSYPYVSFEKDYTKVDGSMFFPSDRIHKEYKDKCFRSESYVSDEACILTITFDEPVTFGYINFNFGESYPVDFDLEDNFGNTYEYRNNTERIFKVEEDFTDVTSLTLTILNMKEERNFFRLYSINFGSGLEYKNDMVLDSKIENIMSPINEFLPQTDFMLKLINENHYFDIDNPKSILNTFDTNTKVSIYYGYELPDDGGIEWIEGGNLYVINWDSDQESASIYAKDILQVRDIEYNNGKFTSGNLYDLAVNVFTEMGIENYYISSTLSTIYTNNPIPRVTCKEALQIIANAAQSKLWLLRDGSVYIGENTYSLSVTSNGDKYGQLNNILLDNEKIAYASFDKDFTAINNTRYFTADGNNVNYLNTGFVSTNRSDENGEFETDPVLTITKSDNLPAKTLQIIFGEAVAADFEVTLYDENDNVLETITVEDNDKKSVNVDLENEIFSKVIITFTKTYIPLNRIYVYNISFSNNNDFTFEDIDIMTYPKFQRYEKIKEIVVPYYSYYKENTDTLLEEDIYVESTELGYKFYLQEPCSDFNCVINSGYGNVYIIDYSAYYVTLQFTTVGSKNITITGSKYTVVEQKVILPVNTTGKTIQWENPLINSQGLALNLATWLKNYYQSSGEYSYETRGNPELDVNDVVYQVNYLGEKIKTMITKLSLGFDGAYSGDVTVLKIGD